MATKKKEVIQGEVGITIPAIQVKNTKIHIVGDSPLIVHAWSEKAKRMMLEKQMKKAKTGKEIRDPWHEFCDSLYWLTEKPENPTMEDIENARFGFPAVAFKAAAIDAAYQLGAIEKKTTARGAFHILGEMVEIKGTPTMREDMVRLGGITSPADLRYRGEFKEWEADIPIQYVPMSISLEQVANMINLGGFACGVGEWRPSRDGQSGRFHVA